MVAIMKGQAIHCLWKRLNFFWKRTGFLKFWSPKLLVFLLILFFYGFKNQRFCGFNGFVSVFAFVV